MTLLPPGYGAAQWQNLAARLTNLRNCGFHPASILDVGAYHGYWAGLAAHIWPGASILSVEANEQCRSQLEQAGRPFEIALLTAQEGPVTYNRCITGCGEGNSIYRENSGAPFEQITVEARTLDGLAAGRAFDLVKMDCQGAELSIIVGGDQTVRAAQVVLLESQVQDYNEGAPRVADVIVRMAALGFRLYDMADLHYNSRGMLLQMDLLFARQDSPLFQVRPLS